MEEVSKYSQMEIAMKDYMLMGNLKAMAHIHGEMVLFIKDSSKMEYDLVMARGPSAAKTIKETILMINGMGRECTNGAIRVIIKGNFLMI